MARRAMNALQLALGSVGSGIQGYTQARTAREAQELEAQRYADEQERLRKAEARQMAMDLANLQGQGYEPVKDVQRKQQAAIGALESMARSGLSGMFGGPIPSAPAVAGLDALEKNYATARPDRTIEYGGQQLALRETPAERQDRLVREAEMRQRRAAEDTARAAIQAKKNRIDTLVASGIPRAKAVQAVELDAKLGDVVETPSVLAQKRGQDISAATARRGQDLADTRAREEAKKTMQRIPVSDKRSMNELEATLTELDKAIAAVDADPNAFGLKTILPNVALGRMGGVKSRAVVTGSVVKLRRTEFGTSMSKQEKESGESIFPGGGDSADATRDKLNALKEKAIIELNAKRSFYGLPEIAPRPSLASFKR